jgi:hypothetical protein
VSISPSQQHWNEFTEELKRIGEKVVGPTGAKGPREQAEAFRYLASLIAAAHELEMEVDPRHPRFTRMFTPTRSFIADGSDTLYHEAKLDENRSYRCEVRRGEDLFFSIAIYANDDEGLREMVSFLIDDDIVFEERDGERTAVIHIGPSRPEGAANWLELRGSKPFALTRQYFAESVIEVDAGKYRPAILNIQPTEQAAAQGPYDAQALSVGLSRVLSFMHDTVDAALGISAYVALNTIEYDQAETTPTRIDERGNVVIDEERHDRYSPEEILDMIDPKAVANNLPGPGIGYTGATYKLDDDEAIVVEGRDVPCRYWSCQLFNHFLQSGDYRHCTVSLNNRQVALDRDGSFRIYAGKENPGVENWLDTEGRRRGQIVIRTLLAETEMDPTMSVIKLTDIPKGDLV